MRQLLRGRMYHPAGLSSEGFSQAAKVQVSLPATVTVVKGHGLRAFYGHAM